MRRPTQRHEMMQTDGHCSQTPGGGGGDRGCVSEGIVSGKCCKSERVVDLDDCDVREGDGRSFVSRLRWGEV